MRLSIFAFVLALVLYGCGGLQLEERLNDDKDQAIAEKTGTAYYNTILEMDSVKMLPLFDPELHPLITDLMGILRERRDDWGKMQSFKITEKETRFVPSSKGDTLQMTISFTALYEYNQSDDMLYITKIGKGHYTIANYGFFRKTVMDCSEEKLEELKPTFQELVENMVNYRDDKIEAWFESAPVFRDSVMAMRNEFFPKELVDDPEVEYHNGYMRQYCGSNNGNNAFLTYKITLNDTTERYMTLIVQKHIDETVFDLYSVNMGDTDGYSKPSDIEMAKRLTKEICRMLQKNDAKGFFNALHEEAQVKSDGSAFSEQELEEMVEDYKNWGKFNEFYAITTVSLDISDGDFIRYVVIAKLVDEEDDITYVEITFRPDSSGKIKLMGFELM